MIPDFCLLIAVDREHVEEFAISYPTWLRHKPSTARRPIVFVTDSCDRETHYHIFGRLMEIVGESRFTGDGNCTLAQVDQLRPYASQREKMLAGLVFDGPRRIRSLGFKYYLKLDTDTCAISGSDGWIDPNWFRDDPAIIAAPWGYTRPASQIPQFNAWSQQYSPIFPLRWLPEFRTSGDRAHHRRVISYCQFGHTEWTCRMADLAGNRLPIPSQDGFLFLCAEQSGALVRRVQMKNCGWKHVGSNISRLRKAAAEALETPTT